MKTQLILVGLALVAIYEARAAAGPQSLSDRDPYSSGAQATDAGSLNRIALSPNMYPGLVGGGVFNSPNQYPPNGFYPSSNGGGFYPGNYLPGNNGIATGSSIYPSIGTSIQYPANPSINGQQWVVGSEHFPGSSLYPSAGGSFYPSIGGINGVGGSGCIGSFGAPPMVVPRS